VHVLTKIFIVLVSLLAVLLVPLVVVYTHNENSFKQRWQDTQMEVETARSTLDAAKLQSSRELSDKDQRIQSQQAELASLRQMRESLESQVRKLETDLVQANANQSGIRAEMSTLASSVTNQQSLVESLVTDNKSLRQTALDAERRLVELDEAYRDTQAQLEVAVAAHRALQEELQRMSEEHAKAMDEISRWVALHPNENPSAARMGGMLPDRDLTASVVNVRRTSNQTLVEINVGERDGVKEGWQMTIFRGGTFIGNLQIIEVDIDRSVGKLSLENQQSRGAAQPGDVVQAYAGRR